MNGIWDALGWNWSPQAITSPHNWLIVSQLTQKCGGALHLYYFPSENGKIVLNQGSWILDGQRVGYACSRNRYEDFHPRWRLDIVSWVRRVWFNCLPVLIAFLVDRPLKFERINGSSRGYSELHMDLPVSDIYEQPPLELLECYRPSMLSSPLQLPYSIPIWARDGIFGWFNTRAEMRKRLKSDRSTGSLAMEASKLFGIIMTWHWSLVSFRTSFDGMQDSERVSGFPCKTNLSRNFLNHFPTSDFDHAHSIAAFFIIFVHFLVIHPGNMLPD